MGEATLPEYNYAMKMLLQDPDLPRSWVAPLRNHETELAIMANKWDWWVCRGWSEKVFQSIDSRMLLQGWADHAKIKEMQQEECALSTSYVRRQEYRQHQNAPAPSDTQSPKQAPKQASDGTDFVQFKSIYVKESEGVPCKAWNRGEECGFTKSHGQLPDRHPHLCSWCASRYKRARGHPESLCQKKEKEQNDKKVAKQSTSKQGF